MSAPEIVSQVAERYVKAIASGDVRGR